MCGLCGTSHLVHNTSACPLCALLGMKGLYRAILPAYYCVYVCASAHAHLVTEWVDNVELVHKSIIKKRLVLSVFCWSIPGAGEILSDKHISLHTWLSITSAGLSDCDSWAVYNGFFDLRVCLLSLVWVSDFYFILILILKYFVERKCHRIWPGSFTTALPIFWCTWPFGLRETKPFSSNFMYIRIWYRWDDSLILVTRSLLSDINCKSDLICKSALCYGSILGYESDLSYVSDLLQIKSLVQIWSQLQQVRSLLWIWDLLQIWSHLSQTVLWVWSLVWVKSLIQSWSQLWVWSQLRVASLLRMKSLMQISCQLRVRSLLWICFMLQIWSFIWAWTVTGQISGIIWSQLRVWYSNTILIPEVKALLWIPCWKNSICFEASLSWSLFGHELV